MNGSNLRLGRLTIACYLVLRVIKVMTSYPPTEVIRGLVWLGSMVDANDFDFLQRNNIKVVINAATEREKTQHSVQVYR